MLSKNDIKLVKSLEHKKFRQEKNMFVAEGPKLVGELLGRFSCHAVFGTPRWIEMHQTIPAGRVEAVTSDELKRASLLKAPQDVIALFEIPQTEANIESAASENLVLALDDVQDPGNLGTIIRIADWFGIKDIFCSRGTADVYNPKAVQATMGAIARVRLHYTDLARVISGLPAGIPVYGTYLDGETIYDAGLTQNGVIVMGNEGNGISAETGKAVTRRIYIPNWPAGAETSESLNVAIATAITCSEFRRRRY